MPDTPKSSTRRSSATAQHSPPHLQIEVVWRPHASWHAVPLLRRLAAHVAAAEGFRRGRLSVVVVGARAMRTLHKRYRDSPALTDVLTFDLGTDRRRGTLDGEIVVCADVARSCARRRTPGNRWQTAARAELSLYLAHGILHLAGYDDHRPAEFRRMHAREDALLAQLGLGPVFNPPT